MEPDAIGSSPIVPIIPKTVTAISLDKTFNLKPSCLGIGVILILDKIILIHGGKDYVYE